MDSIPVMLAICGQAVSLLFLVLPRLSQAFEVSRTKHSVQERGRNRSLEYCRSSDGCAFVERIGDSDYRAFEHKGSSRALPSGRYLGCSCGSTSDD